MCLKTSPNERINLDHLALFAYAAGDKGRCSWDPNLMQLQEKSLAYMLVVC